MFCFSWPVPPKRELAATTPTMAISDAAPALAWAPKPHRWFNQEILWRGWAEQCPGRVRYHLHQISPTLVDTINSGGSFGLWAVTQNRTTLARIIHDFGDKKNLLWYKHVEMTMFEAPKEAFAWVTTPQQSVFCSPIFFRSPSSRNLTSGRAVPMAAPPAESCRPATGTDRGAGRLPGGSATSWQN